MLFVEARFERMLDNVVLRWLTIHKEAANHALFEMKAGNLAPGSYLRGRYVPAKKMDIEFTMSSYIYRPVDTLDALRRPC